MTTFRKTIFSLAILLLASSPLALAADRERALHSFNGKAGANPFGGVIFDAAGNLYGTTSGGGSNACSDGCGTVFELTPTAGKWAAKVLHAFNNNGSDGYYPLASLVLDKSGNLYGTTYGGGAYGRGTVFELTQTQGGAWTEAVLYSFSDNGVDGSYPEAGLIFDDSGNLYGTTFGGGAGTGILCYPSGCGTVFELTLSGTEVWTENVLYDFDENSGDGFAPLAGLAFDSAGNLYGTTIYGGAGGYQGGTVFKVSPTVGEGWTETIVYSFGAMSQDGGLEPRSGIIFDTAGDLYGTTALGGTINEGTVYELIPGAGGIWTEKVLHSFNVTGTDGYSPYAALVMNAAGSLYGTTVGGGSNGGTVFVLKPTGGGRWSEKLVYEFNSSSDQGGYEPYSGLIFDARGNLYGTTSQGGKGICAFSNGCGTVFEISP